MQGESAEGRNMRRKLAVILASDVAGYSRLAVLDVSGAALAHCRSRLGEKAAAIEWFQADVTSFTPPHQFALWHDRAVFHFLTDAAQRQAYVQTLRRTLTSDGVAIIGTFAIDGPTRCSGWA